MTCKIVWLKKRCPVCRQEFDYIENGYEPSTCNNFKCLYKWMHDPYYNLQKHIDQSRIRLGNKL